MPIGEKIEIEDVRNALIECEGMPTLVAKKLNVTYPAIYRIIKEHPELQEIQKSYRQKSFFELGQMTTFAAKTGYIRRAKLDDEGKMTSEFELVPIDYRTQLDSANRLMQMTKSDAGITEDINLNINEAVSHFRLTDE